MSGDYTRFTFWPPKNYEGVLKQQGRVALDADWNEAVEIGSRRWRAETIDLEGRCWVGGDTPDAFRIDASDARRGLTIQPGRLYVDGLLAENFGAQPKEGEPAADFDPVLAEPASGGALSWGEQPFGPGRAPLDLSEGSRHLIYLDVWQREVTALQDGELREVALGGSDTTTRVQTVWQVRAVKVEGDRCEDEFPEWDRRPPGGRLTTSAVAPPASEDPCIVSPAGGYRGTENRLYRVEIHRGGDLETARFKWSRDNASVQARVETVTSDASESRIRVNTLGRDAVLRFAVDQWIEVLDDPLELEGEPGHLARITAVDEANRVLTIEPPIPASLHLAGSRPERNTRVRRWDQFRDLDAEGLMATGAGVVDLENGIRVSFSEIDGAGGFRTGDYWVFAARTADGSVEELVEAPPRGIHHHYCRLALVHGFRDGAAKVDDCRPRRRPEGGEGCCTVVVRPGESIQAAIDSLPEEGGCVCLKPGTHLLTAPIRIQGSNVTLHGETLGAEVVREDQNVILQIQGTEIARVSDVTVHTLSLVTHGGDADSGVPGYLVTIKEAEDVRIVDCRLAQVGRSVDRESLGRPLPARGVKIRGSARVAISSSRLTSLRQGVDAVGVDGIMVDGNALLGAFFYEQNQVAVLGGIGIEIQECAEPVVRANTSLFFDQAVWVEAHQRLSRPVVEGNRLLADWWEVHPDSVGIRIKGSLVTNCSVESNQIALFEIGVAIDDGADFNLSRNHIAQVGTGFAASGGRGVRMVDNLVEDTRLPGLRADDVDDFEIRSSRFRRCASEAPTEDRPDGGSAVFVRSPRGTVAIESCEVLDTGREAPDFPAVGIRVEEAEHCVVRGNTVGYTDPAAPSRELEHRALVVAGPLRSSFARAAPSSHVDVSGNSFDGPGASHLVEFERVLGHTLTNQFDRANFSHNRCEHRSAGRGDRSATVSLFAGPQSVIGNHIQAADGLAAIDFHLMGRTTVMGNVVTGAFLRLIDPRPAAPGDFNVFL